MSGRLAVCLRPYPKDIIFGQTAHSEMDFVKHFTKRLIICQIYKLTITNF